MDRWIEKSFVETSFCLELRAKHTREPLAEMCGGHEEDVSPQDKGMDADWIAIATEASASVQS